MYLLLNSVLLPTSRLDFHFGHRLIFLIVYLSSLFFHALHHNMTQKLSKPFQIAFWLSENLAVETAVSTWFSP